MQTKSERRADVQAELDAYVRGAEVYPLVILAGGIVLDDARSWTRFLDGAVVPELDVAQRQLRRAAAADRERRRVAELLEHVVERLGALEKKGKR